MLKGVTAMFFIFVTALIAILCVLGFFRTLKAKNMFGAGFSFVAAAVFGWFTVMEFIKALITTPGAGH